MLANCTTALDLNHKKWRIVNDHNLYMGGELIIGGSHLYYIGGNKSKAIYEYQGEFGWKKWNLELPVPSHMKNSWDVMGFGAEFCSNKTNDSRGTHDFKGWKFIDEDNKKYINLFDH